MATTVPPTTLLDQRELRAWRGMLRTHAALTKALDLELEAEHGLSLTSYEVLLHVEGSDGDKMRMCDLASSVLLSRSGLTRLVDRLERDGLIARQSCTDDARGQFAVLTAAGREKLHAAQVTYLAGVRTLFLGQFTPEEQELLGSAWDRVLPAALGAAGTRCRA
jgi:DNA-binding MarR family transcriptional regulator